MKKVAVVVLAFALIIFLSMAAPAFADSPKKLPVVFSTSGATTTEIATTTKVINPDGTVHVWGAVRTANAKLTIGGGPELKGSILVNLDYIVYPDLVTTQHYHKMVITFPAISNPSLSQDGILEGVLTWKADLTNYAGTFESHVTFQGSGAFEGYIIRLDRDTDKPSITWALIN